jgi:hypothetical protein
MENRCRRDYQLTTNLFLFIFIRTHGGASFFNGREVFMFKKIIEKIKNFVCSDLPKPMSDEQHKAARKNNVRRVVDSDTCYIEGIGNINFQTTQTGF